MYCATTAIAITLLAGCGATKSYVATEQLLLSDAVDSTIEKLDFTPLAGKRVFLDTEFVSTVRSKTGQGLVGPEYVISSVRERMLVAGCKLCRERGQADIIAELRIGAMATDAHSVVVGLPATNQVSSIHVDGSPIVPTLPELSVAKSETMSGGAKVAVFAYQRDTREAVWQSGVAHATSDASDTWVLGVGPRQRGSIHRHDRSDGRSTKEKSTEENSSVVADQAKHRSRRTASGKARQTAPEGAKLR